MPLEIRPAVPADHDALFVAFVQIVASGDGFPQAPPLARAEFDDYWVAHASGVWIGWADGSLAGAYYLKPNFVGRAAHIANAGYFIVPEHRGHGYGRALVEHSLVEAPRLGFDAMQFNLVFESNAARALYHQLGFRQIGQIPDAVDGEDAVIYWRSLKAEAP